MPAICRAGLADLAESNPSCRTPVPSLRVTPDTDSGATVVPATVTRLPFESRLTSCALGSYCRFSKPSSLAIFFSLSMRGLALAAACLLEPSNSLRRTSTAVSRYFFSVITLPSAPTSPMTPPSCLVVLDTTLSALPCTALSNSTCDAATDLALMRFISSLALPPYSVDATLFCASCMACSLPAPFKAACKSLSPRMAATLLLMIASLALAIFW